MGRPIAGRAVRNASRPVHRRRARGVSRRDCQLVGVRRRRSCLTRLSSRAPRPTSRACRSGSTCVPPRPLSATQDAARRVACQTRRMAVCPGICANRRRPVRPDSRVVVKDSDALVPCCRCGRRRAVPAALVLCGALRGHAYGRRARRRPREPPHLKRTAPPHRTGPRLPVSRRGPHRTLRSGSSRPLDAMKPTQRGVLDRPWSTSASARSAYVYVALSGPTAHTRLAERRTVGRTRHVRSMPRAPG